MAVLKEWRCLDHGEFEGSHPICPFQPCDSRTVVQEFRTAPKIRSSTTSRTDQGLKRSADIYGVSNFRSCREGEVSKPPYESEFGIKTLWGDEAKQELGAPFSMLANRAHTPTPDRSFNSGLAAAATSAGITSVRADSRPPSCNTLFSGGDTQSRAVAHSLVPSGMKAHEGKAKGRV